MGVSGESDAGAFAERFHSALARLPLAGTVTRRWLVAFSGGLDSTLLLHQLWRSRPNAAVVAIHVDHGLHADSALWAAHCRSEAEALGVDYIPRVATLQQSPGQSLEAIARTARYAILADLAEAGDVVLTAHHSDDQLETVLLRLLRGTGVRGLQAIHSVAPCGAGQLARPLLDFSRAEIETEARRLGLRWLEDPSNVDRRFDRNYLRAECLPRLLERWPRAGLVANRLARQMTEAEIVLGEVAASDLGALDDPGRIPVGRLRTLSEPRQNNALRFALRAAGLPVPSAAQLAQLRRALTARGDAEVLVSWPGAEARLYRQHLYLQAPTASPIIEAGRLAVDAAVAAAGGELRLVATQDYGIPDRWARDGLTVAYRAGGERFRPERCRYHKSLKQWFQDQGIVPWMRNAVPLLYHDDQLIAVADICLADDLPHAASDGPFWRPQWTGHARLR